MSNFIFKQFSTINTIHYYDEQNLKIWIVFKNNLLFQMVKEKETEILLYILDKQH